MLDWLISVDTSLFQLLNGDIANPLFDVIMPIATNQWFLRGIFAVILLLLMIFGKRRGRIAAIYCVVTVVLADLISAQLIKPLVGRIRPCHMIVPIHLLVDCSQGLSFPSSHAANSFSLAVFLSQQYPRAKIYLVAFAVLVSFSRIAVGVHYPLDVLAGGLVGVACGLVVATAQRWILSKFAHRTK